MGNRDKGMISNSMTRSEFGEEDNQFTWFENYNERIIIRDVNIRVDTQDHDGSAFVWGNVDWGILGSYQVQGSLTTPIVRQQELRMWMDYRDEFNDASYVDAGNTTATIGGGSYFFTEQFGGQTFVPDTFRTINLGSDVQLASTDFTHAYVHPIGSLTFFLSGSVSSDGGTTWTGIPQFKRDFEITSNTGSELIIQLDYVDRDVELHKLIAYFRTEDVD